MLVPGRGDGDDLESGGFAVPDDLVRQWDPSPGRRAALARRLARADRPRPGGHRLPARPRRVLAAGRVDPGVADPRRTAGRGCRPGGRRRVELGGRARGRGVHRAVRRRHARRAVHAARAAGGGPRRTVRGGSASPWWRSASTTRACSGSTGRGSGDVRLRDGPDRPGRPGERDRGRLRTARGHAAGGGAGLLPRRAPAVRAIALGAQSASQVRQNAARAAADVPEALWDGLRAGGLLAG